MKVKNILSAIACAAGLFGFAACADTDAQYSIPNVDSPLITSVIAGNDTAAVVAGTYDIATGKNVVPGQTTIIVKFDKNVGFSSAKFDQITLNSAPVKSAVVYGASTDLTIVADVPAEGELKLNIPAGTIYGPTKKTNPTDFNITWTGLSINISSALTNANATAETKALYEKLVGYYGQKMLASTMAQIAWNKTNAERVNTLTGKYPAITTADYIHLASSPANWIDYGDLTWVNEWNSKGGIMSAGWHWTVPQGEEKEDAPSAAESTVWEGTVNVGTDWGTSETIAASAFADVTEGTKLHIYVRENSDAEYWQIKFMDSGWNALTSYKDVDNGWGCIPLDAGATSYTVTLNSADADALKSGGAVMAGYGITYTKVTIENAATAKRGARMKASNPLTYTSDATGKFGVMNAVTSGTWENKFVDESLDKLADYLKKLQDKKIPVIWRPLHEAKGNYGVYAANTGAWFWWGQEGPEAFKNLWIYTYNYLKGKGVNNLIWVWTDMPESDSSWYPGDEFVDIVGVDIYNNSSAESIANIYKTLQYSYTTKMVTLSECGSVSNVDDMWNAGAKWLYVMPWYDNDGATSTHATDDWWKATMSSGNVITLDQLK